MAAGLVLTAAVALGVAALALLSPLQRKLREQEVRDLVSSAVQSRSSFKDLDVAELRLHSPRLQHLIRRLASVTGARVALLDSHRRVIVETDPDEHEAYKDFASALAHDRAVRRVVAKGPDGEARVALRVRVGSRRFVLALRKPLNEQRAAVDTVRRAFGTAALAALAVALILAAAFATTVPRRLRRLRDAVGRFGTSGEPEELPDLRRSDEVGDLTRAFSDLRERLAAQEDIRRAFIATASHELRTPLMSLQGRLELLDDDLAAGAPSLGDARTQLHGARGQADRLARLAADLLDVSRLDAQLDLRTEPVELGEISRAVVAEFEARGPAQECPIALDAPAGSWALADPGAVARILRILLDNALRFSPRGEAVELVLAPDAGGVCLTVADRGPGVQAEDRERIFERFERGRDAAAEGGFGLGLTIGRELALRMRGRLELRETGPGGGTTFVLWLPHVPDTSNQISI